MNGYDRWFRFSLNFFIFLMFFQLGSLLVLRSSYRQAQNYVKDNQAKVSFKCGDFHQDETYWKLPDNQVKLLDSCLDLDCPQSLYRNKNDQETEMHVLSVERPWPYRWEGMSLKRGNFVDVKIAQEDKPLKLVLVSQSFMLWDLDLEVGKSTMKPHLQFQNEENWNLQSLTSYIDPQNWNISYPRKIEEVIVVAPDLVWIEGLEPSTKVTYFDQKQICTYPVAWEEIANPENQFRRLALALKEYTQLDINSFQGKDIGRKFKLPFRDLLAEERVEQNQSAQRQIASAGAEELGLQWSREGDQLKARSYKYRRDGQIFELEVPEKTTQAFYEFGNSTFYLIKGHRFGTWDPEDKKFEPLHLPLRIPAMNWPTAFTFNPLTSDLLVYNDDRGGEIYAYNVVKGEWRVFAHRVGYSLMAIHYDTETRQLVGARFHGSKISELVRIREKDLKLKVIPLQQPLDFAKQRWHADLTAEGQELWLKVHHPAQPGGDLHPLQGS